MKTTLRIKEFLLMSAALFSMHFGASCLLYPMTWGRQSGCAVLGAFGGVFLTAILLPLLGYVSLSRSNVSFLQMAQMGSKKMGLIFCSVLVLVNGPLYVIPRMSAAAWSAVAQLLQVEPNSKIIVWLLNALYYGVIYWFLSSRAKTMNRLGKILSPILIGIVAAVILKGCFTPSDAALPEKSYSEPPFVYGLLQGYATGDLMCSLMFGVVILNGLRNNGLKNLELQKNLLLVGCAGMGILALAHFGHMMVGARNGAGIDLTLSSLYMEVVVRLFGRIGGVVFLFALVAASMSAAVGIGAANAEFFSERLNGRISYRSAALMVCAISFVVSCAGLERIVAVMGPVLDACYPAAIVLVLYFTFVPRFETKHRLRGMLAAMICATVCALLNVLHAYDMEFSLGLTCFEAFYRVIPLSKYGLFWIPVSAIAYGIGSMPLWDRRESDAV